MEDFGKEYLHGRLNPMVPPTRGILTDKGIFGGFISDLLFPVTVDSPWVGSLFTHDSLYPGTVVVSSGAYDSRFTA